MITHMTQPVYLVYFHMIPFIEFNRLCTVFDDHSYYISFIIYAIFYLNKYLFLFNAVSALGLFRFLLTTDHFTCKSLVFFLCQFLIIFVHSLSIG